MNKHQFKTLCERILIPKIDALLIKRLAPLKTDALLEKCLRNIHERLEITERELAHIDRGEPGTPPNDT